MEKCKRIVTHPITVLLSYIIAVVGFILTLSGNLWVQIGAVSVVSLCMVVFLIHTVKWHFNVKEETELLEKAFQESHFDNAHENVERFSNLIRDIITNSLNAQNTKITDEHFQSACKNICKSIGELLSTLHI